MRTVALGRPAARFVVGEREDVGRRMRGGAAVAAVRGVGDGRDDPDALAALLDRRAALASRTLGDWCAAFFDE
ncbi:hypothetical protein QZM92_26900, partial [Burkholderia multivorans]|nr:hypothetical protein [Burkholderia multivorans]